GSRGLLALLGISIVGYALLAGRFYLARPTIAHNYWNEINAARRVPEAERAHSPLQLAQEMVGPRHNVPLCRWRMLVAAMMHIQTPRITAHPTLWRLLATWPTPVEMTIANASHVEQVIRVCGLSMRRSNALVRMSRQYLVGFDLVENLVGCGRYVSDSDRVFHLGDYWCSPLDGELAAYCIWRILSNRRKS
ncbi:hypothetical protein LCGC14_2493790, partial [marine sediment metagenome]